MMLKTILKRVIIVLITSSILSIVLVSLAKAKSTVTITNYWRSPEKQAELLLDMKERGVDLKKLYIQKDIIKKIEILKDKEDIAQVLRNHIRSDKYLSKHMCGKAIDVRKNKGAKDLISFLSKSNDIKILDEGNHFHLELYSNCKKEGK